MEKTEPIIIGDMNKYRKLNILIRNVSLVNNQVLIHAKDQAITDINSRAI